MIFLSISEEDGILDLNIVEQWGEMENLSSREVAVEALADLQRGGDRSQAPLKQPDRVAAPR